MRSKAKVGHFLTYLCAAFMYGGGFFYHTIMPLSAGKIASTAVLQKLAELEMQNSTDLDIQGLIFLSLRLFENIKNIL